MTSIFRGDASVWLVRLLVGGAVALAATACGSLLSENADTPASDAGAGAGKRGQACYPNATCDVGFACDREICRDVDAGAEEHPPDGGCVSAAPGSIGRSCNGMGRTCGPQHDEDCCAAPPLPAGDYERARNGDGTGISTVKVSGFALDKYEITVGRLRAFVDGCPGYKPARGDGKNSHNTSDEGWDEAWNAWLFSDRAQLVSALACDAATTWTDSAADDSRAMNCISWYMAFAFCIWDGGRLPTEAEWGYAATGGRDQRPYPWGPESVTASRAVFLGAGGAASAGSKSPAGDGRWGQSDLAGNLWEWTVDWRIEPFSIDPCNDCAAFTSENHPRAVRGGSFFSTAQDLSVTGRVESNPNERAKQVGARCARNL